MGVPRAFSLLVGTLLVVIGALPARPTLAGAPPVALDDGGYLTPINTPVAIPIAALLANDFDPDGGPVIFDTDFTPFASNGSVWSDGASLIYTPNPGFTGGDIVTYQIEDSEGLLDTAISSVFVYVPNNAPVAVYDEFLMGYNETLIVQGSGGLFANDYDPDGDAFWLNAYDSSAVPGAFTLNDNGGFSFTPPAGFSGTVVFSYSITDGESVSNVATAAIIVVLPSTPPTAAGDAYATAANSPLNVAAPGILANDWEIDEQPLSAQLVQTTSHGTLALAAGGGFSYTPNPGFSGVDSFQYRAFDGSLSSNVATVTISVSGPNVPPVAGNDEFQTPRDTPISISFAALLANDGDAEGDPLSVAAGQITQPSAGELLVDTVNGRVIYTPPVGFIDVATFTYRVSDGVDLSGPATVRVTVTNVVGPTPTSGGGAPAPTATRAPGATGTVPGGDPDGPGTRPTATPPYGVTQLPRVGAGDATGIEPWRLAVLLALCLATLLAAARLVARARGRVAVDADPD